ncbi:MAG TPA: hypothetical protein VMC02_14375 [Steroidobacteraceae bacterium]|nr:hypothetical protein [Steroidobacteraceae bacterium]
MADENSSGSVPLNGIYAGESRDDYRARLAGLQAEALERWRKQLVEQSSTDKSPAERIRVWEQRHQIDLPRDPAHRLIRLIAENTGLSTEQVRAEQQLRAQPSLR